MALTGPDHRRLLDKLTREVGRIEGQAIEHPPREARRLGDQPPVRALREVAEHAVAMRPRFETMALGHGLVVHRFAVGALTTLRHLVIDRVVDPERSYRSVLLELRHGIEVVRLLREATRREELVGLIRWCDDWLTARRTLVARAEAQLAWFAEVDEDARPQPIPHEVPRRGRATLEDDEEDPSSPGMRDWT